MIEYHINETVKPFDVVRVFDSSGIRRPTRDLERISKMFSNANLVVTATNNGALVGVCRALTDFCYSCFISDLAVDAEYQNRGIGRHLVKCVKDYVGDEVSIVLLSAPDAIDFYPRVGFSLAENAYILRRVK